MAQPKRVTQLMDQKREADTANIERRGVPVIRIGIVEIQVPGV